ncbi:hypothetical protein FOMPIDRAFT_1047836 [Fomitopsis schrenkii]|uniref:Uncharacterized protein n=1 Tax=Fomitopsis schrenkii TaxID=2126942 RepID=S8FMC4_FOMSC|nr:hypothetical protein FOMPIDRAFT_1047836 [Fomitopsis schrenkii]
MVGAVSSETRILYASQSNGDASTATTTTADVIASGDKTESASEAPKADAAKAQVGSEAPATSPTADSGAFYQSSLEWTADTDPRSDAYAPVMADEIPNS